MRSFVRISSRAVPLLAAVALTACAANRPATRVTGAEAIRATLDSAGLLAQEPGPEIRLRAEQEFGGPDNIDAVLRLDDDAYVMVVNVGPDGYARVVFPETPADDGLLRGGRSYRLPSFFPGFATNASSALSMSGRFIPFQRSEFASVTALKVSAGNVEVSGSPPANEITSGRVVIDIMSRIAEDFMTRVRDANSRA